MSDVKKIGSAGIPLNIVDANGRKIMGDAYDNTAIYAVGDYCISGDHAYKCITEIETPEDFNTNHWQQITIEEILKEHDTSIELVNSSLTNKELWAWQDNTRFQMLGGGYKNMGSYVIINLVVKAKTSATNSPSISSVASAYKPTVDTALSCIDITSGISSAITDSVPCGISSAAGTMYIKSIITDHIYAITGYYLIA